jgi:hypothetical protein
LLMGNINMNSNINTTFQKFLPYVLTILFAYIVSTGIFLFLPKSGVEFLETSQNKILEKSYTGFYSNIVVKNISNEKAAPVKPTDNISKYVLKAIYSTTLNDGWIILENKSSRQSDILKKGEKIGGYMLIKLYKKYVIFEKNSKEYRLELPDFKDVKFKFEQGIKG